MKNLEIKVTSPKKVIIPEEENHPSKKMFKSGFMEGLKQGRVEAKNGFFSMDSFNPTIGDGEKAEIEGLNFGDSYEIGYELGYMRAKMESLGYEIGNGYVAANKIEGDV